MPLIRPSTAPALYLKLTLAGCILFGLAAILNTQLAGDAATFWYACFLHSGRRLYSGMHLALQPLYVLETAASLALFGKGWLVSKITAVLHLVAYCFGLFLIARAAPFSDRVRALLLACVFFLSIAFVAYRFDDYHVLADCFQVYSLAALLALQKSSTPLRRLSLPAILGVLSGLALTTRLNDGAALTLGVVIAIAFLAPSRRLLSLGLFAGSAAFTLLIVVRLTGDSVHDWASNSIFKAAGSKGGASSILAYPLQLPVNALRYLAQPSVLVLLACFLGFALAWVFLIRPFFSNPAPRGVPRLVGGVLILVMPFFWLGFRIVDSFPTLAVPPPGVLIAYALALAVVIRTLGRQLFVHTALPWHPREVLLLIPLGQLASGSMSSGGSPLGLNGPLAILLLLIPIAYPIRFANRSARAFALTALVLLTLDCAAFKYRIPFQWHSYTAHRMFTERQWYRHPLYGPMLIERDQLAFIQSICDRVEPDAAEQGLLSLPYPFPNYFCGVPPWHGYVQTFYDTSTRQTIEALVAELTADPPEWIVYQRQPYNMTLHEQIFNRNQPLPHRALDQLIEQKLASGAWQPVYTSTYGSNKPFADQWILIRTSP